MTDPTSGTQPTEEELRVYLEQLREADVAQVLVQAYQLLGTGAEVKLGRRDARVLIDAMAGLAQAGDGTAPAELVAQMREGVRQLQVAQVQAETEAQGQVQGKVQGQGAAAGQGQSEPAAAAASGQPSPSPTMSEPGQAQEEKLTDRLWVPGRGAPGTR